MTPSPGIKPETHWWKAIAFATAPNLLSNVNNGAFFGNYSDKHTRNSIGALLDPILLSEIGRNIIPLILLLSFYSL